jgi:hypothetical protein
MSQADDRPELRLLGGDPDPETGLPRFDPAGPLPGVVRLEAGRTFSCRGIYLRARWRVRGQGSVDQGDAREICLRRERIDPGPSVELPFEYALPTEPWSYAGRLITIEWELAVRADVPGGEDRHATVPFILAPRPPGATYAGPATLKREGPEAG